VIELSEEQRAWPIDREGQTQANELTMPSRERGASM